MKKILVLLLIVSIYKISAAQYKPVEQGSSLKFTIKNLGFGVDGSFSGFEGSLSFDPNNPANNNFDVTIQTATVNTNNNLRDEHLREDGYFDVKNNPKIRLVSTKIAGKNGSYTFSGLLTIKGKTKAISFPFTATPSADGFVFKGSFRMNRHDFNIGGTSTVSDEVEVNLTVATQKA